MRRRRRMRRRRKKIPYQNEKNIQHMLNILFILIWNFTTETLKILYLL